MADIGRPGWMIEVRPKAAAASQSEYTWVVTIPYRGFNPRYLTVSYGYSAKEIVGFDSRELRFVRNEADYETAASASRGVLGPENADTLKQHVAILNDVPTCTGTLRILDSRVSETIELAEV